MSLAAMVAVMEDSQARGIDRLVLLAIANSANDEGTDAWPLQQTIADNAGVSKRTVQRSIESLQEMDELVVTRASTRDRNFYTVVVASKRAMAKLRPQIRHAESDSECDRRQVDACGDNAVSESIESGANHCVENTTDVNLSSVTRQNLDGGKKATGDNLTSQRRQPDVSETPLLAAQEQQSFNRSLSTARARHDKLTPVHNFGQGSLIPKGTTIAFDQQMRRKHRGCHSEVCSWNSPAIRFCMPAALVPEYAAKLVDLKPDEAIVRVIAWAQQDVPPAGYVAPGSIFEHWAGRWDATMANAPSSRAARSASVETSRVPDAAATDVLIDELISGRFRS
jgi:DNA-binding MarR family transcriptional regulator